MTPAVWESAPAPADMLAFAAPRLSDRKLRLFLVGCCRRRWELFSDPRCRRAVDVAERLADGLAGEADRLRAVVLAREAHEQAQWAVGRADVPPYAAGAANAAWVACDAADDLRRRSPVSPARPIWAVGGPNGLARAFAAQVVRAEGGGATRFDTAFAAEQFAQADLLRCVGGNAHVYLVPDPAWRTTAVLGLARAVYAERAFDRLPILADALEEAGCEVGDVLGHCRDDREHARGCWVVDALLDRS